MTVGSLVECIKSFTEIVPDYSYPKRGKIYTVRGIEKGSLPENADLTFLLLEEIVNPVLPGRKQEPSFVANNFRELQPRMVIDVEEIMEVEA